MLLWPRIVQFIGKIQILLDLAIKGKNSYNIKVFVNIEKLANKLKIVKNSSGVMMRSFIT